MSARDTVLWGRRGPVTLHLYWWPETRQYWVDLDWRFRTLLALPLTPRTNMSKHLTRILKGTVFFLTFIIGGLIGVRYPFIPLGLVALTAVYLVGASLEDQ